MIEVVKISHGEVVVQIEQATRTVKLSYKGVVDSYNMDIDPYPRRGPLYDRVREICGGKQSYIMKVLYPINKNRFMWDKYVLF